MRTVLSYTYLRLYIASPCYVAAKSAGICQVGEGVEGVPARRDSIGEVKVLGIVRGLQWHSSFPVIKLEARWLNDRLWSPSKPVPGH